MTFPPLQFQLLVEIRLDAKHEALNLTQVSLEVPIKLIEPKKLRRC